MAGSRSAKALVTRYRTSDQGLPGDCPWWKPFRVKSTNSKFPIFIEIETILNQITMCTFLGWIFIIKVRKCFVLNWTMIWLWVCHCDVRLDWGECEMGQVWGVWLWSIGCVRTLRHRDCCTCLERHHYARRRFEIKPKYFSMTCLKLEEEVLISFFTSCLECMISLISSLATHLRDASW